MDGHARRVLSDPATADAPGSPGYGRSRDSEDVDVSKTIHRLKITLGSVRPPIWRRIEVDSDMTLGELSDSLEAAMG